MEYILQGTVGRELGAEEFLRAGLALSGSGRTALGWQGGDGAAMLARALGAGLCAGGDTVLAHDGCCPAAGAWMGRYYALPLSLFVEQTGEIVRLYRFGKGAEGKGVPVCAGKVGGWEFLRGIDAAYAAAAARHAGAFPGVRTVAVPGQGKWDQTLSLALEQAGVHVVRRPAAGAPAYSSAGGGFHLIVNGVRREGGGESDALFLAVEHAVSGAEKFEVYFSGRT